ncbi:MAG: hypothetical protein FJX23_04180 [Alphaproteobacteria bacterium]|nr:hypothetical protein [Alphaproteobacteria bacterium]
MRKALWAFFILSGIVGYVIVFNSGENPDNKQRSFFSKDDEECLHASNLRIQVADMNLSIPRDKIYSLTILPDNSNVDAKKLCQKPNSPQLQSHSFSFKIIPLPCDSERDCNGKKVHVGISDAKGFSRPYVSYYEPTFAESCVLREEISKAFSNEWFDKYGEICRIDFLTGNVQYVLQFRSGVYPAEKLEQTKELVLKYINDNFVIQNTKGTAD